MARGNPRKKRQRKLKRNPVEIELGLTKKLEKGLKKLKKLNALQKKSGERIKKRFLGKKKLAVEPIAKYGKPGDQPEYAPAESQVN